MSLSTLIDKFKEESLQATGIFCPACLVIYMWHTFPDTRWRNFIIALACTTTQTAQAKRPGEARQPNEQGACKLKGHCMALNWALYGTIWTSMALFFIWGLDGTIKWTGKESLHRHSMSLLTCALIHVGNVWYYLGVICTIHLAMYLRFVYPVTVYCNLCGNCVALYGHDML